MLTIKQFSDIEQLQIEVEAHDGVETKNAHALRLYESVGFKVVHAQDYYVYEKRI